MTDVFIAYRHEKGTRSRDDYEGFYCRWCGTRAYAHPESSAWADQACADCCEVVERSVKKCAKHGDYAVLVKKGGGILGDCIGCHNEAKREERRQNHECEICGAKLSIFARLKGDARCSKHK